VGKDAGKGREQRVRKGGAFKSEKNDERIEKNKVRKTEGKKRMHRKKQKEGLYKFQPKKGKDCRKSEKKKKEGKVKEEKEKKGNKGGGGSGQINLYD